MHGMHLGRASLAKERKKESKACASFLRQAATFGRGVGY
jgi:hypothetical protein